jgi:pheromone shutdown protein TraB
LIDQDISITLKRFSQKFSWKEKFRLVKDIFKSFVMPKKMMKKYGITTFDLHKVPDQSVINKLTGYLKDNYPNIHQVLIVERNKVIANNLYKLSNFYPDKKIIAVLGAGHVDDVIDLIKDFEKGKKDGV